MKTVFQKKKCFFELVKGVWASRVLMFSVLLTLATLGSAQAARSLSDFVDPLIGTQRSPTGVAKTLTDSGLTQPGPTLPFGMISWGPDTVSNEDESARDKYDRDVGYNGESHRISGFSLTHLSGAGCPNGGELPVLPFVRVPDAKPVFYTHEGEKAEAGYYRVQLLDGGVPRMTVELTTQERTGFGRFTFEALKSGESFGLQFFHSRRVSPPEHVGVDRAPSVMHFQDSRHFSGSVVAGDFCQSSNEYRLYFSGELSQAPEKTEINSEVARVYYPAQSDGVSRLELKIAISYISEAQASLNLKAESRRSFFRKETFFLLNAFKTLF